MYVCICKRLNYSGKIVLKCIGNATGKLIVNNIYKVFKNIFDFNVTNMSNVFYMITYFNVFSLLTQVRVDQNY